MKGRFDKGADQAVFPICEVAGDPGVPVAENPPVARGAPRFRAPVGRSRGLHRRGRE